MANEKRLIDANAFIKELDSFVVNPPFAHPATPWHRGITLAAETALRMPTVDAVEVVHGRWIQNGGDLHYSGVLYCCSVCGKKNFVNGRHALVTLHYHDELFNKPNYCPNCGAKMDGDGNGNL